MKESCEFGKQEGGIFLGLGISTQKCLGSGVVIVLLWNSWEMPVREMCT